MIDKSSLMLVHVTTVPETLGFLRGQLRFMQSRGFAVHVITAPGTALTRFAAEECVIPHAIPMRRRITPLGDIAALARLVRRLRALKPDIVHSSTPKGGLLGTVAARIAGVPLVVYHVRGLAYTGLRGFQRRLLKLTERTACALAHRVICVSESVRRELIDDGIGDTSKLKVLASGSSNGVAAETRFNPAQFSAEKRKALRREFGLPMDAIVIGFVGRLVKDKGVVELADAWAKTAQRYPGAWLLVVGEWEDRDAVPGRIRRELVGHPRVKMVGERLDVAQFYAMMDVVVLPTYREGFPNVPLEAAAMQLPVVGTSVTGCVDAVRDEETGLLVPVADSNALFHAISRYLDDDQLRVAHGRSARERVLREFTPETVWQALHTEYVALLAETGHSP